MFETAADHRRRETLASLGRGEFPEKALPLTPPLFVVGWWFLAWLRGFSELAM